MAEYDNTNKGALWKVENPESEKHPNFKGSLNVEGTEYWVSAWATREPEGKRPHIRFSIKPKDNGGYGGAGGGASGEDIPFAP